MAQMIEKRITQQAVEQRPERDDLETRQLRMKCAEREWALIERILDYFFRRSIIVVLLVFTLYVASQSLAWGAALGTGTALFYAWRRSMLWLFPKPEKKSAHCSKSPIRLGVAQKIAGQHAGHLEESRPSEGLLEANNDVSVD